MLTQAVEVGAVAALAKVLKARDEDDLLGVIGRIAKELCTEVVLFKRLLQGLLHEQPL